MSNRFALLVGVSDYSAFDRSAGQPRGTSDLFGPPQNLAAMWQFCTGLGFTAPDIGLLATPLTPPRAGHPAVYGEATKAQVLEGVRALATRLAACEASQGLFYFSGHGDFVDGVGPVLCTSDTELRDGRLHEVVPLAEVAALLSQLAPGKKVTFILDSCGSGLPSRPSNRVLGRLRELAFHRDGDTLLSASGPHRTGIEIQFDGEWHGALTWALCTAASQYVHRLVDGFVVPDLSVENWVDRARRLLQGLSADQRPVTAGDTRGVVLQPTGIPPIVPTNQIADQRRGHVEIWGGETGGFTGDDPIWSMYEILSTNGSNSHIGNLVTSFGTPSTTLTPYADFWQWGGTAWPSSFKLAFVGNGKAGVNTPPGNLPPPKPMQAYVPGLSQSQFSSFAVPSSTEVWAVYGPTSSTTILAYLTRNTTNNALTWLITWAGYDGDGYTLTNLPSPSEGGGVVLNSPDGELLFQRYSTPPATVPNVAVAYPVPQYAG